MSVATFSVLGKDGSVVALAQQLEAFIREAAQQARPLHEVERTLWDRMLQIGHTATEQFLAAQGDGDLGPQVQTTHGQCLQRSDEPVDRPLRTVFGRHTIRAYVYAPGPHEKIPLRPVDARLQLPAGCDSYLFQEFSQYFCVEQAFGQATRAIALVLRQQVSVDSLERINHHLGAQAAEFLDQLPTPPRRQEGELLVLSGDCKGVPLVQPDAARLPAGAPPPQRPGNRRMATLATVYSVDPYVRTPEQVLAALFREDTADAPPQRPRPQFKHVVARFGRTYADDADALQSSSAVEAFSWASAQVSARRRPGQPLIRLMDGQESLWEAAELCLELPAAETIDILDILHVSSAVWRAAKVLYTTREHQEAFAHDRLLRILQGEVVGVISGMRQMASKRHLTGSRRKQVESVCQYLENNARRMRYDEYLRAGYPISTGVIEGACRHLVKDRMERSGMRWRLESAQAMLDVRAVYQSSYWEEFHRWRIAQDQSCLHPHRTLIPNAAPQTLAA